MIDDVAELSLSASGSGEWREERVNALNTPTQRFVILGKFLFNT